MASLQKYYEEEREDMEMPAYYDVENEEEEEEEEEDEAAAAAATAGNVASIVEEEYDYDNINAGISYLSISEQDKNEEEKHIPFSLYINILKKICSNMNVIKTTLQIMNNTMQNLETMLQTMNMETEDSKEEEKEEEEEEDEHQKQLDFTEKTRPLVFPLPLYARNTVQFITNCDTNLFGRVVGRHGANSRYIYDNYGIAVTVPTNEDSKKFNQVALLSAHNNSDMNGAKQQIMKWLSE